MESIEGVVIDIPKSPMIYRAIVAIMRAVEPIAKSQKNTEQKYNFRGIDQVYNAVHPHFAEHGVFSTSTIIKAEHKEGSSKKGTSYVHAILTMQYTFWAEDGSSVSTEVVGEGMDYSGDKASNKAMSAADKYAILQLLKIPTASVDSDGLPVEHPNPAPDANAKTAQPRDQRITRDQFDGIFKEWLTRQQTDDRQVLVDTWREDCLKATGLTLQEFNPSRFDEWTADRLDAVCKQMGLPQ
jgi:hypothetical protein